MYITYFLQQLCCLYFDLISCFAFVTVTSSPSTSHTVGSKGQSISSSLYLRASVISDWYPKTAERSSNSLTIFMLGSLFDNNYFIAALILVILYSPFTHFRPRPSFFLDTYNRADDDLGCFSPFVSMIFHTSWSILLNSVSGQCCVHMGYLRTTSAHWLEATTWLASDNGLDQITDKRCRYTFSAHSSVLFLALILEDSKKLVLWIFFQGLYHYRIADFYSRDLLLINLTSFHVDYIALLGVLSVDQCHSCTCWCSSVRNWVYFQIGHRLLSHQYAVHPLSQWVDYLQSHYNSFSHRVVDTWLAFDFH